MAISDFRLKIAEQKPGDKIDLKIFRDGKTKNIEVTLDERPDDRPSQSVTENETEKLGISVADLTTDRARRFGFENEKGVMVIDVKQGSAAARKGVIRGDLITSIDRKEIENVRDFERIIRDTEPGDVLLFRIKRNINNEIINISVAIRMPK